MSADSPAPRPSSRRGTGSAGPPAASLLGGDRRSLRGRGPSQAQKKPFLNSEVGCRGAASGTASLTSLTSARRLKPGSRAWLAWPPLLVLPCSMADARLR